MKIVIALVCLFAAATAYQKRQVGICVEECNTKIASNRFFRSIGVGQCPDGQTCASNGCGHTCQPDKTSTKCNAMFCFMFCEHGYVQGPDGCNTCKCMPDPKATTCPGVMCAMYCEGGFQTGADGCPVCKCQAQATIG